MKTAEPVEMHCSLVYGLWAQETVVGDLNLTTKSRRFGDLPAIDILNIIIESTSFARKQQRCGLSLLSKALSMAQVNGIIQPLQQ